MYSVFINTVFFSNSTTLPGQEFQNIVHYVHQNCPRLISGKCFVETIKFYTTFPSHMHK